MIKFYIPVIIYLIFVFICLIINFNQLSTKEIIIHSIKQFIIICILQLLCNYNLKIIAWIYVILSISLKHIIKIIIYSSYSNYRKEIDEACNKNPNCKIII